jgi:hypothetical protein
MIYQVIEEQEDGLRFVCVTDNVSIAVEIIDEWINNWEKTEKVGDCCLESI